MDIQFAQSCQQSPHQHRNYLRYNIEKIVQQAKVQHQEFSIICQKHPLCKVKKWMQICVIWRSELLWNDTGRARHTDSNWRIQKCWITYGHSQGSIYWTTEQNQPRKFISFSTNKSAGGPSALYPTPPSIPGAQLPITESSNEIICLDHPDVHSTCSIYRSYNGTKFCVFATSPVDSYIAVREFLADINRIPFDCSNLFIY